MARLRPRDFVELGPGSCEKVRVLFDALPSPAGVRYVAVDVGRDGLTHAAAKVAEEYPSMDVHAVVADFERHLSRLPPPSGRRLLLFFGSTIGNFDPPARRTFLTELRGLLGPDGRLLLGVDLVKEGATLEAAYDDAAGVTAAFNKNVLAVLNAQLGADFDLDAFDHVAAWDAEAEWIEMRLRSAAGTDVRVPGIGLTVHFGEGEEMRTEISAKFTRERLEDVYAEAGLRLAGWFTDPDGDYALTLASV